jgi:hypothetical protein
MTRPTAKAIDNETMPQPEGKIALFNLWLL